MIGRHDCCGMDWHGACCLSYSTTRNPNPSLPHHEPRPQGRGFVVVWGRADEPGGEGTLRKETSGGGGAALATGYCVKCKASREIKDAQQITMKNGRPATQGICPVCGTKIFKIGAST